MVLIQLPMGKWANIVIHCNRIVCSGPCGTLSIVMMNSLCQDVLLFRKWRVPLKEGPICDLQLLIIVINGVNPHPVITNVVRPTFAIEIEYDREGKFNRLVNNFNSSDKNNNNHDKMNIFVDFISMSNPFIHEPIEELTKRNNSIWIQSIISKTYKKKRK